ncbi:cation:proton antiporter [Actinomadura sp. 9N407]|uniref:cation:proton antiporter domain-containing protein n=1 Tax=Actinomadura sp. 9N407 TaxID=3375154 RepID=UPI0037B02D72
MSGSAHQFAMFVLALAVILVAARAAGVVARRLGQPAVVGEIIAGIALGPTLLGGQVSTVLFPADIRPSLATVANLGLALFMFSVGLDLDWETSRRVLRTAVPVAVGAMLLPFVLGIALGLFLIERYPSDHPAVFVAFLGVAMSVTAFPVLARIVDDNGLSRTDFGVLALSSAAICDVVAWSALAVLLAVAGAGGPNPWSLLLVVPYAWVMFRVVRPVLRGMAERAERSDRWAWCLTGAVLVGLPLSSLATEGMGLHFVFGAFLFGAVMPRTGSGAPGTAWCGRCLPFVLPVFFAVVGLGVDLSGFPITRLWDIALIVAVAAAGKLLGGFAGARLRGLDVRRSSALAVLMNTRGLAELVVLAVGLRLGVLGNDLYSLMVVMAVATTVMTGPLLRLVHLERAPEKVPSPVPTLVPDP